MELVRKIMREGAVLDFETFFDSRNGYTLSKMTTPEFVHDPRFHLHGVALRIGASGKSYFFTGEGMRSHIRTAALGRPVIMHNAYFDDYILCNYLGINLPQIIDTQCLALAVLGNKKETGQATSLKELARRLGLQPKGDLTYMDGRKRLSQAQMAELAEYACGDVDITYGILCKLLPLMPAPDIELPYMQHTIRLFTGPGAGVRVNPRALEELRTEGRAECEATFNSAGISPADVAGDKKFANLMFTALQRTGRDLPKKQGKNGSIPALAKTDPAMQELVDDPDAGVAGLARARLAKKSLDQFERRLEVMERVTQKTGGILPIYMQYFGSHTGRVSGGDGLNHMNLGREGLQGAVRNLYLPSQPEHLFVIGDASQIEARILAWLAGQQDLLCAFAEGRDVYQEFADRIGKGTARAVGKECILALGFGMGIGKLLSRLRAIPAVAAQLASGEMPLSRVREMHETYRDAMREIVSFWAELEDSLLDLCRTGCPIGPLPLGYVDMCGEPSAWIELPSGRRIFYPRLRIEKQEAHSMVTIGRDGNLRSCSIGGKDGLAYGRHGHLYGGKIAENITQAVARDVLRDAVLACEAAGWHVAWHVFDEIILDVPAGQADEAARFLEAALGRTPSWAPGLPLKGEVFISRQYCKGEKGAVR